MTQNGDSPDALTDILIDSPTSLRPANPIQPLSEDLIGLIAAGEVIDALAAVVRELVENALDAGASRITVSLWPQRWQVRVADNGTGMSLADLQRAAMPHATSKIVHRPDLLNIRSLGFRGEALHSIAQLARLEICSRLAEAAQGYQISYDSKGYPTASQAVAIAPGSIVTVNQLFDTWPARQQVPSLAQQVRAIQPLIGQLALCHPQVTWIVEKNDAPWFSLWPGESAKTLMPQLLRSLRPDDIRELRQEGLYLAVGLPDRAHRQRSDWVKVAVNGRPVEVSDLFGTLVNSFRRTLPRDRYPICFLHLTLPPGQVDWNRHPAKSDIYVQGSEILCDHIAAAVEQLLTANILSPAEQTHRATQLIRAAEESGRYAPETLPMNLSDPLPSQRPSDLKAIAQVQGRYILAEYEGGLCLIEQHIAHERVLYEQLQQQWQMSPVEPPIVLEHLSDPQADRLIHLGIDLEPFGDQLWAARSVPTPLRHREDCAEALQELSNGDLEAALVATACRTALRNGTPLSPAEMQTLVDQWQRTQRSRTCPHGRPICLTLKETSLAKYFRRRWVVGRSHGI